jgi:hypothetical protein
MSFLPSHFAILVAVAILSGIARADVSELGVIGPHSGPGFSNLGAITKAAVATTLTKADVLIELQGRKGDDLTAACTAVFDFDTDPGLSKGGETLLVAFPVTAFSDDAVSIAQFEVLVDGARKPEIQKRSIQLYSEHDQRDFSGRLLPIEATPSTFEFFGYVFSGETRLYAFIWSQKFTPGKHCRVEVKYVLTLHAQSLAYAKKFMHGQPVNVVPFDAMWAGESGEKAFFFDYILRSGGTWNGPIGHETVTLAAAPNAGVILSGDKVVTFGRHAFAIVDDLHDGVERRRAGLGAPGIVENPNSIIWQIDHEKPQRDILVEITIAASGTSSNLPGKPRIVFSTARIASRRHSSPATKSPETVRRLSATSIRRPCGRRQIR